MGRSIEKVMERDVLRNYVDAGSRRRTQRINRYGMIYYMLLILWPPMIYYNVGVAARKLLLFEL